MQGELEAQAEKHLCSWHGGMQYPHKVRMVSKIILRTDWWTSHLTSAYFYSINRVGYVTVPKFNPLLAERQTHSSQERAPSGVKVQILCGGPSSTILVWWASSIEVDCDGAATLGHSSRGSLAGRKGEPGSIPAIQFDRGTFFGMLELPLEWFCSVEGSGLEVSGTFDRSVIVVEDYCRLAPRWNRKPCPIKFLFPVRITVVRESYILNESVQFTHGAPSFLLLVGIGIHGNLKNFCLRA